VLGFAIVVAIILAVGVAVSRRAYSRFEADTPSPLELLVAGAVVGTGLWVALSWTLAVTHTLTRPALLLGIAAFAIAAATQFRVSFLRGWEARDPLIVAALLPVGAWASFILWRGAVIPAVNHDALSYHLPKAVLFMHARGFPSFELFDHRFPSFPANYELLVADVMVLLRSDRITEWIGTVFYLFFLLSAALLVRRWWGGGAHVAASILAVAAAPVVLLHSGADKNDLMTQFFVMTALIWGSRWVMRGGVVPMTLLVISVGLAVGTKTNAAAVALGLAPFLLARILRKGIRILPAVAAVACSVAAFLLCGGVVFISALRTGALMGVQVGGQSIGKPLYSYRMWTQLWEIPIGMVAAGLSGSDSSRDVIFSSHFGPLPSILAILLPLAWWRYRKVLPLEVMHERTITTVAALLAFAVMLPTKIHAPAMPRYALFMLPVVVGWTVAPATRELLADARLRRFGVAVLAVLAVVFTQQAIDAAINDSTAPLDYVLQCAAHPGTRQPPSLHQHASVVADQLAGPRDTIAFDGDISSWIYPAYGAELTRNVVMLPQGATAASIPDAADWVVIERWWAGGKAPVPLLHAALLRDARFRLVFYNKGFNHSVFQRVRQQPSMSE